MKKIGILGAGQLAQMLAQAAKPIGLTTLCFADSDNYSAASDSEIFVGKLSDFNALTAFAKQVNVITLENENIPEAVIDHLSEFVEVMPPKKALLVAQDRLFEKQMFEELDIPCASNAVVDSQADLENVASGFGFKGILKTRRLGYDGKGQHWIRSEADVTGGVDQLQNQPAILEGFVSFDSECSQIAARNRAGEVVFYPLMLNEHVSGILRRTLCPSPDQSLSGLAQQFTKRILEHLDYVGVLTVEFFVEGDQLIANEIAPRVHNSGHATIEATNCSQFENHCRAVADMPLVQPEIIQSTEMINVIGEWENTSGFDQVHDYNKSPRAGRKLGHLIRSL